MSRATTSTKKENEVNSSSADAIADPVARDVGA